MHNTSAGSFNKEKLIFLGSSAVVAAGLYLFLASGPIGLEAVPPIAYGQRLPGPLISPPLADRQAEDFYVVDGKVSKLVDKRTGLPVNRDRLSPFEPFKTPTQLAQTAIKTPVKNPVPPPPPAPVAPAEDVKKPSWNPKTAKAEVEFMGAMTMSDGETYGLLKPIDGSPVVRVKIDSIIEAGGEKYTVTAIEKQAIWVVDEDKNPYMLKDSMFEEVASADSGSDASKNPKDKSQDKSKDKPKNVAATDTPKPAVAPKTQAQPNTSKNGKQRRPPRTNLSSNGG